MAEDYINLETSSGRGLVSIVGFDIAGVDGPELIQNTIKEINLTESLLTPGLQTSVTMQSAIYIPPGKNFDRFKNKTLSFSLRFNDLNDGRPPLTVSQQIYRLDNRRFMPLNVGQTEEFTIHACDQTLLNDAKSLVSRSWKCTRPSEIVNYVLENCVGADRTDVETADPARDYIAENIHPFQVIAQQSNVALAQGNDPSFVHYMTYENLGTHHFRSLKTLTQQAPVMSFEHAETGLTGPGNFGNQFAVINFSFPCDFDYLTDLLNGLDENGQDRNSLAIFNQKNKSMSLLGNQSKGCGLGGFNFKIAMSNQGTSKEQDGCNHDVETHLLKRQARMHLLDRDKIALRITVPWNARLNAGKVITLNWRNKTTDGNTPVYGSGNYLISSLTHTIKLGGFSTTTMDCVATTVGSGVV